MTPGPETDTRRVTNPTLQPEKGGFPLKVLLVREDKDDWGPRLPDRDPVVLFPGLRVTRLYTSTGTGATPRARPGSSEVGGRAPRSVRSTLCRNECAVDADSRLLGRQRKRGPALDFVRVECFLDVLVMFLVGIRHCKDGGRGGGVGADNRCMNLHRCVNEELGKLPADL